jgi:hypothetical protein
MTSSHQGFEREHLQQHHTGFQTDRQKGIAARM